MSGIYRWNLNPFILLFLSFFFTKIRTEVDKSLRKLGDIKADTHSQRLERRLQKRTRLGRRVLRHKLAQGCAFSCIMTCFSCAAMVFRYSKRARTFFTKYVPSRSFGGHVTWNSAVPDLNVWCCILLFLCTLGEMNVESEGKSAKTRRARRPPRTWTWTLRLRDLGRARGCCKAATARL